MDDVLRCAVLADERGLDAFAGGEHHSADIFVSTLPWSGPPPQQGPGRSA